MNTQTTIKQLILPIAALALISCSTAPKGEIASTANPQEQIEILATDLEEAQKSNIDVLARDEYMDSYKHFNDGREDFQDGKDQEKILDNLRYAKKYLKDAYIVARTREGKIPGLFQARQKAIAAGANSTTELKERLKDIDEDVADIADSIDEEDADYIAELQARYVQLEKSSVIEAQLGEARAQIRGSLNSNAERRAPLTLKKAQISFQNAESLIGTNVSNPAGFRQAVAKAKFDAQYLSDTMEVLKQGGKSLTESAALQMVSQNRQISNLEENLSMSEDVSSARASQLGRQDRALGTAQASLAVQQIMERSRQQFTADEAEAYQQGENLLIRLKAIDFESGRAEVPSDSMELLTKVSEVAKSLGAREIKVIGHTDSTGSKELNKRLSEERARSVATYFKTSGMEDAQIQSEGRGFEDPIATNKSKEGRAQNRRVDVIITPNQEI